MTGNPNHVPTTETYDIRIARDGAWWHEGRKVERSGLVKLFASVLQRDDDGNFWLVTPAERGMVVVEDAPFVAVEMEAEGSGREQVLRFRTNLDEWVTAGAVHPIRVVTDDFRLYVEVRGGLEALLARSVYYELIELALNNTAVPGVWSGGVFFTLNDAGSN